MPSINITYENLKKLNNRVHKLGKVMIKSYKEWKEILIFTSNLKVACKVADKNFDKVEENLKKFDRTKKARKQDEQ